MGSEEIAGEIPDVRDLDFREVARLGDSAIARALKRVKNELEKPGDAVAGFQSAVG